MADDDKNEDKNEDAKAEGEGGEEGAEGEGGKKKLGKKKLIMIVGLAFLLLAGGAGGAYYAGLFGGGEQTEGDEEEVRKELGAQTGNEVYVDIPEFLVNLNTNTRQSSFLKVTIVLELASKEDEAVIQANMPRIMDSFNTYLRELRPSDLYGSAGMYRLREELMGRVNKIIAPKSVKDLLFKQILIQ